MKTQNTCIVLALFFISFNAFSQVIGTGFPDRVTDFSVPLKSGVYNGLSATGRAPDDSYGGWQHLFVIRHESPASNFQLQLASSYAKNDKLFFRKIENGVIAPENNGWNELATRGANTFIGQQTVNGQISVSGTNAFSFSSFGGGLYMLDDQWIRTYGNKHFYHNTGIMRTDGTLQVGPNGDRFVVNTNGNVGIGTTAPAEKLDVAGNIKFNSVLSTDGRMHLTGGERLYILNKDGLIIGKEWGGNGNLQVQGNTIIDGNVGIGAVPDAKLTVNGQIHTKEVRIDVQSPMTVPDYVFANDYKLKTLSEVDQYVKANSHLPEIPSATAMAQNGMLVSEMNLSLLKKIEELTLYAIEQQKKLDAQNNAMAEQNKAITEQNNAIVTQNKQLELLATRLSNLEKK
jgi:uncharacterized coiled-coil protein SlyX